MKLAKLLLTLWVVTLAGSAMAQDPRQVVVTGEGRVGAEPDMARVFLGVTREARSAGEALRLTSEAMTSVLATIEGAGIDVRDFQTSNVGLSPRWQRTSSGNAPPRITGYVASNDVTVRVRDLDLLGGLLDALVADGANQMNGISFAVADPSPLIEQARIAAVADAKARADTLAQAAGVTLGPVLLITEGGITRQPAPMMRGAMSEAAMDVPIAGGELDFVRQVTMTFELLD